MQNLFAPLQVRLVASRATTRELLPAIGEQALDFALGRLVGDIEGAILAGYMYAAVEATVTDDALPRAVVVAVDDPTRAAYLQDVADRVVRAASAWNVVRERIDPCG